MQRTGLVISAKICIYSTYCFFQTCSDILFLTIKLYPNPCHNYINIENANNKNISVYDVYGRMISKYTATSDNFVLNTQAWKGGVYVLKIGEQCYRIVKE